MRILILNRVEPPARGATGRLAAELAAHLRAAGHDARIISAGNLPPKIIPYLWAWLNIGIRALCARRADRVIVMTDPPMLALWIPLLKLRHGKMIYWCQDLYPDLLPIIGVNIPLGWLRSLKRWALRQADITVALGRCMAEKLKTYTNNIRIIPNWSEAGAAAAPPENNFTILYAGNLGRAHPVEAIAAAMQSCAALPVQFIIMADGQGIAKLHALLSDQHNVKFLSPQNWQAAKTIQENAHLHLVALRGDATGLAVPVKYYASLRAARPVIFIGDAQSEIARHILEQNCGDVVAVDTPEKLAEIIHPYLASDYWRARIQAAQKSHESLPNTLSLVAETVLGA